MKKIKLTKNQYTLVSNKDYKLLNQYNWYALKSRNNYYAARTVHINGKKTSLLMHEFIMNCFNWGFI